jgi:hypothetical protein
MMAPHRPSGNQSLEIYGSKTPTATAKIVRIARPIVPLLPNIPKLMPVLKTGLKLRNGKMVITRGGEKISSSMIHLVHWSMTTKPKTPK